MTQSIKETPLLRFWRGVDELLIAQDRFPATGKEAATAYHSFIHPTPELGVVAIMEARDALIFAPRHAGGRP